MDLYKILFFTETPDVKNQIGYVSVLHSGEWLGLYKIVRKHDGSYFVSPPTIQGGIKEDGKGLWKDGLAPERKSVKDALFEEIRLYVKNLPALQSAGVPF